MTHRRRIDPELRDQLDRAAASGNPLEVVFRLQPDRPDRSTVEPTRTEQLAHDLLARVEKTVGEKEQAFSIFRNLGSFAVRAQPEFIRVLMDQPEVAAAAANRQPDGGLIPPERKEPVTLEDIGRRSARKAAAAKRGSRKSTR